MASQQQPVKVAMIGLGWWGRKMTAVLQKAKHEIEIVCAAEPSPAGAEFAEANGYKLSAVHRWTANARKYGFLPADVRSR